MWENWALLGAIFVCVPVLMLLKENYNRLTIDESSQTRTIEVKLSDGHVDWYRDWWLLVQKKKKKKMLMNNIWWDLYEQYDEICMNIIW